MEAIKRTEIGWAHNDLKANEMHENADKLTYYYDE